MGTLIQERYNHTEIAIAVKASWRRQKIESQLAKQEAGLAFCSTDLGHLFKSNVGKDFGVLLRAEELHKPKFAYVIVRIHALMIYTNLIEYQIVNNTKVPLLRCCPFVSEKKTGEMITNRQYNNYQTFSNLQFKPLLKNCFHCLHVDLRHKCGEKLPCVSVGITRQGLMFRKLPFFIFNKHYFTRWLLQDK